MTKYVEEMAYAAVGEWRQAGMMESGMYDEQIFGSSGWINTCDWCRNDKKWQDIWGINDKFVSGCAPFLMSVGHPTACGDGSRAWKMVWMTPGESVTGVQVDLRTGLHDCPGRCRTVKILTPHPLLSLFCPLYWKLKAYAPQTSHPPAVTLISECDRGTDNQTENKPTVFTHSIWPPNYWKPLI